MAIPSHLRAVGDIAAPEAHIAVTEARLTGVTSNITKGREHREKKKEKKKEKKSLTPPAAPHTSVIVFRRLCYRKRESAELHMKNMKGKTSRSGEVSP